MSENVEITKGTRSGKYHSEDSKKMMSESHILSHQNRRELQNESLKIVYEKCLELERKGIISEKVLKWISNTHISLSNKWIGKRVIAMSGEDIVVKEVKRMGDHAGYTTVPNTWIGKQAEIRLVWYQNSKMFI